MDIIVAILGTTLSFGWFYLAWRAYSERTLPSLALQEISVQKTPTDTGPQVFLRGRPVGLTAIIQAMFGVEPSTTLIVMSNYAEYQHKRLAGTDRRFIPLEKVTSIRGGFYRPVGFLVVPIIFGLMAIASSFFSDDLPRDVSVGFTLIVCGCLAFYFNQKVFIVVDAGDRSAAALGFQANALSASKFSVLQAMEIVTVIRRLALLNQSATGGGDAMALEPGGDFDSDSVEVDDQAAVLDEEEFQVDRVDPSSLDGSGGPDFSAIDVVEESRPFDSNSHPEPLDYEAMAQELFSEAKKHIANGNRNGAIEALQELLRHYPHSELANRARSSLIKKGIEPAG